MINRRQFLQAGAAATAALAWPLRAYPFTQSLMPIPKFVAILPGLGIAGQNQFGNYIPVLEADRTTMPGTDIYRIVTKEFTQNLIPPVNGSAPIMTKLWGYADADPTKQELKYLGGVIIAKKNTPVQLIVTNELPPLHILPVDKSLADQEIVPTGMRTDIIAVHLHGGLVFWNSDGGPFAWFANPANGGPLEGPSFANPGTTRGQAIYNYPNGQSARTIWYHDHAYSLTRTNVFAGLASAFLIVDTDEEDLIGKGILPGMAPPVQVGNATYQFGIPLIIQDKTFWDGDTSMTASDPTYPSAVPSPVQAGSLWYPHVYEGALDAELPSMTLTDVENETNEARWGAIPSPGASAVVPEQFPSPSTVPEYFSDTILVNGAPYPTLPVTPRRYRFRFLNGSNARFYNLQLYVAIPGEPDGIRLVNTGDLDPNGNPVLAPANRPGPAFIQIANEAGFLPKPALFSANGTNINSNRVMGFKLSSDPNLPANISQFVHRRADAGIERTVGGNQIRTTVTNDPTLGNADRYNLLLAPAERPDVIIDFRGFAGQTLVLYNDAPAPFPGGDIRNDYYVGAPSLTNIGGAPAPVAGFGPDTRIIMQFVVDNSAEVQELSFAETVTELTTELQRIFPLRGDPPLPLPDPGPTMHIGKSLLEDNEDIPTAMPNTFGRLRQLLGDGTGAASTLLDPPIDVATEGEVQYWDIFNLTADTHPMHFHLVNVNVIRRAQYAFDPATGNVMMDAATGNIGIIEATSRPPDDNEMGWKETVRMNPGEVTTVAMKFDLPPGTRPEASPRFANTEFAGAAEYVWHCHILEHEEHDMMHPLLVLPGGTRLPAGFRAVRRR